MKEIPEDWSKYLKHATEDHITQEKNKKVVEDLKKLWKQMPKTLKGFGARSVRENRDNG